MPRVVHADSWEVALRDAARDSTAKGWSLREHRGKPRLICRIGNGPMVSVTLPMEWRRKQVPAILARVRNIYVLTQDGYDLPTAAAIADGKSLRAEPEWSLILEEFRLYKLNHGTAIQPRTWKNVYEPVLQRALAQLQKPGPQRPTTAEALIEAAVAAWPPGTRARQYSCQNLAQFLRFAVERFHCPNCWLPPVKLTKQVGRPSQEQAPGFRKGNPIPDLEILALIDSLQGRQRCVQWASAFRLLALLGLRPVELHHLSVRLDPSTGEPIWWCSYRKRTGSGLTAPRRLYPLPLRDWDGRQVDWDLLPRWQSGLVDLPNLYEESTTAQAVKGYLRYLPAWQQLQQRMNARGERAVPYSFRHSYSLRGHRLGIDSGSMAAAMGHTLDVHLKSYPWASSQTTAAAFSRALVQGGSIQ